ncbi:DEAD/DEAH box helicase [Ningiella sp. W23]|uniref:DEAD/DEAH box helicase n=1 Tax=Ningiella sp. W23 TaxID=3023715 RepID=UPI003756E0CF
MNHLNHLEVCLKYIDFARNCYREDSYYLSLSNIDKLASERRILLKDEELLASGELQQRIVVSPHIDNMREQVDIYRKERMLIYGCLMVKGQLTDQPGLTKTRNIHSPIFYFPAQIMDGDDLYFSIDTHDLRLNSVLLRQLLRPDVDASIIEAFPSVTWPVSQGIISKIDDWLSANTLVSRTEELVRWPSFRECENHTNDKTLAISTASCLVLADRTKGSRGILHELKSLLDSQALSRPIQSLFTDKAPDTRASISRPELLPSILSTAQTSALFNAANHTLSLISGPPGTGKSYTIAAIAIDRMLQGESVIIVTKSAQATDVIGHLLKSEFGLDTGYVCANEQGFIKSLKSYLSALLNEGVNTHDKVSDLQNNLMRSHMNLRSFQKQYRKLLWSLKHSHDSNPWYKKCIASAYLKFYGLLKLWDIKDDIKTTQKNLEQQSAKYINAFRTNTLQQVLVDYRKALVQFQSGLRARNSKTADERFAATDFDKVLKAFPIWLLSTDELNRVLPFSHELFDLVIMDEATQCDMASGLPALQRAKRACIVGDGKQLRHLSFLSKNKQELIRRKSFGDFASQNTMSYRDQSLLDIVSDAISTQSAVCMLDEHFRSKPELISFSNSQFYDSKLIVMQARPNVSDTMALHLVKLPGKRSSTGKNKIEKDAVITEIERVIQKSATLATKPSIGVMSPYREQAQYIENAINRHFTPQQVLDFRMKISTPFGFQGEERDIVFISFCIDNVSSRAATYLNKEDMFNVLVTRSKQAQKVFYSIDYESLKPDNLLHQYLSFEHKTTQVNAYIDEACEFAGEVKLFLEENGATVWIDNAILGQQVDIICSYSEKVVAIDLIGFPGKFEAYSCFSTYGIFNRAGVAIIPLPYIAWRKQQDICKEKLMCFLKA